MRLICIWSTSEAFKNGQTYDVKQYEGKMLLRHCVVIKGENGLEEMAVESFKDAWNTVQSNEGALFRAIETEVPWFKELLDHDVEVIVEEKEWKIVNTTALEVPEENPEHEVRIGIDPSGPGEAVSVAMLQNENHRSQENKIESGDYLL